MAAGEYLENIDLIDKTVSLVGAGADVTRIDGGGNGSVVVMTHGVVEGFTLTNGRADVGGGLYVGAGTGTSLADLVITGNMAEDNGGGLYIDGTGGDVTARGVRVEDNSVYGYGGGGVYVGGATATIDLAGIVVSGNDTAYNPGGGVYLYFVDAGVTVSLAGATIEGNDANGLGGGVYARSVYGTLDLSDAVITDNTTTEAGGGVYVEGMGTADLAGAVVTGNAAAIGGGVYADLTAGTMGLGGATMSDNAATESTGGVQLDCADASVDLGGASIQGNDGPAIGGIRVELAGSCAITMDEVVVAANESYGLVAFTNPGTSLFVANATLVGNGGDGAYVFADPAATVSLVNVLLAFNGGYGLYAYGSEPDVRYSNAYGNAAGAWEGLTDPTGTAGNVALDPELLAFAVDADPGLWDLHLAPGSPLFDAGDPARVDTDGSASEIGAYSGSAYYADADADALYDGWEERHGLDASADDSANDLDGDGLSNAEELALGTDPSAADTDGDLASDADEVAAGSDPLVVD